MSGSDSETWTFGDAQRYGEQLLVGELVRLRGLRDSDLDSLVAWRRAPDIEIFQAGMINPVSDGMIRDRLRASASNAPSSDGRGFCVETLEQTGESGQPGEKARLLGFVTLRDINPQHRSAEFAIALDPSTGGHGFGADATRVMVRYAFRELGLHRVSLNVWAYNERAHRAYVRAGFVEEGRLRDVVFHDGKWHDAIVMSALETDAAWA